MKKPKPAPKHISIEKGKHRPVKNMLAAAIKHADKKQKHGSKYVK